MFVCPCMCESRTDIVSKISSINLLMEFDQTFTTNELWDKDEFMSNVGVKRQAYIGVK